MEQPNQEPESFKPLTVSTPPSTPSTKEPEAVLKSYAAKRARLLFGCYRKGDANDPETFVAAITAVLSRYDESVIRAVTHPAKGLPIRTNFLPTVKEVYEACEALAAPKREEEARKKRIEKQMAERQKLEAKYPIFARDSVEARAVRVLHDLVGRTSAFFTIFRKGDGSVTYTKRITPQLAALGQSPPASAWRALNRQQAFAWEELLRQVFDSGLVRTYLTEGSTAPYPWPPSLEGKIYDWDGPAPTMTEADHEALASEGQ